MSSLRVLIVEDYQVFRRFICSVLKEGVDLDVVGEASDGQEAVQRAVELQPDLILFDIGLPKLNGLEAARQIRSVSPASKMLFLSQESSSDMVREALSIGALGYVHKLSAKRELLPAIDAVRGGKKFVSAGLEFRERLHEEASHRHEILFSSDDAVLMESLARFIAAALNAGNPAIVLITESHQENLIQALQTRGVDLDDAVRRGTYVSLDADDAPDPLRFFEAVKALSESAAKAGKEHPRVAVCGERAGRLWVEGKIDEAMQLEQLCEDLAKTQAVDILCAYPFSPRRDDDSAFANIRAHHTVFSFQ